MAKLNYWERREAQDMYNYMESAEKKADEIAQLYLKASRYISTQADQIFDKYKGKYGLSESEARRLLNELKDNQFVHFDDGMIHSDQGWHYTNPQFRIRAAEMGLQQSMSRRGNCWDNAPQESFFGHLKDEVDIKHCNTFDELHTLISDYIDYYNNDRYQWNLNKMTPIQYRNYLLNTA